MATKRMINNNVVGADSFLDLPLSTQALYFHLMRNADDDGIIASARSIIRMVGASNSDLDALTDAGFILKHESGAVVVAHWKIHNSISPSKKHKSDYKEVVRSLRVTEDGVYTFDPDGGKPLDNESYQHNNVNNFSNVDNYVDNYVNNFDGENVPASDGQPLFNEQNEGEAETDTAKTLAVQGGGNLQKIGGNLQEICGKNQKIGGNLQTNACIEQSSIVQSSIEQSSYSLEETRREQSSTEQDRVEPAPNGANIKTLLNNNELKYLSKRYENVNTLLEAIARDATERYGDKWQTEIKDPMAYTMAIADKELQWKRNA